MRADALPTLTLDRLREVEDKLSADQWAMYIDCFATPAERLKKYWMWERASSLLHASRERERE